MTRGIIIIEDKAVNITGNRRRNRRTVPHGRSGSECRHQSHPQGGCAERLRGVPLYAT